MNKISALIISIATFIFAIVVLFHYGAGEGSLFTLGVLGMPFTLLGGMGSSYIAAFLYLFQYQLIAFVVFKCIKSKFASGVLLMALLTFHLWIILMVTGVIHS